MWTGYFTLGGNEVGNSARALGYARTSDCPITWLRDVDCGGLPEFLGDGAYVYANIADAPWYDTDTPDLTGRFLGLYIVSMEGISDSTRSAEVTEKIIDGGQVSGYRHTSRQVRVRAMLTAKGMDALEAGMTWLRNVLEPNACGVHGADCGASDLQFFVDCPPTRGFITSLGTAVETRRNYLINPNFELNAAGWTPENGAVLARYTTSPISGTGSGRLSGTAGGDIYSSASTVAGDVWTFSLDYKSDGTVTGTPLFYLLQIGGTPGTPFTPVNLPLTQVSPARFSTGPFTIGSGGTTVVGVVTVPTGGALILDNLLLEKSGTAGTYFDGNSVDTEIDTYAWVGTTNASQSTLFARPTIEVPETDDEYETRVESYMRFLHTVTCVSGPLVQSEYHSSDKIHYGYLVEFTMLAAVPFVFGLPREITVPPSTPTVVADAAFNLVPYPSAELASGTVLVATNYSPNPSVEVNSTDWAATSEVVSGTSPAAFFTSGRVTGELAATGSSSFRVRILGNNGSTVVTNARSYMWATQAVTVPVGTGTRMSFNVWAALVEYAGASGGVPQGIHVEVQWRATTTVLSTVTIGATTTAAEFSGKAFSLKSILKPPTANNALVRVRFDVTWSSSATPANNSEMRGYVDALAVTVP